MAGHPIAYSAFPDINPAGAPQNDFERINTSPDMFGGLIARSEETLGQGIDKAADAGFDIATQRAKLDNQVHGSELHSWFSDQAGELISQFSQLQGKAALEQKNDYFARIDALQKQAEDQAGNPEMKAMVAVNTRQSGDRLKGIMTSHADQQRQEWYTKTAKDNITSATGTGGLFVLNNQYGELDQQMRTIDQEAHNYFDPQGYDAGTLKTEVSKYKGSAVKNWVETAATNDKDPDNISHALQIFERYAGDIDPVSRLDIQKYVNAKAQARTVNRLGDYYIGGTVAGITPGFIHEIKQTEGYREKPYWDVKQWSVGYGTRASGPNETPDRAELEGRFQDEVTKAANFVDSINPKLDPGTRAAMTSLTYNAGEKWANDALGKAIKDGDINRAQQLFLQYNHAGGQVDQGLVQRRMREAEWFGRSDAAQQPRLNPDEIVDRIAKDPLFRDRPELQHAVMQNVIQKASMFQRADALEQKQIKEKSDATEWDFFKKIHTDDPNLTLGAILNNPNLTKEAGERLTKEYETRGGSTKTDHTYGPGFYDLYRRVHLPQGDPDRITDPNQLYAHVGPAGDLTVGGVDKLRSEIDLRRSPDGVAESEMRAQFLKNARAQITGTDEGLHIRDPKGDELYLKFMAQAWPLYDKERKAGKSPAQLLDPDSPDYVGKVIGNFKRPMDQWFNDTIHDNPADKAPNAAAFDVSKVKTIDDLVAAYRRGDVNKQMADEIAIANGWGKRKPVAPQIPMSQ
jgi:GH24 family phage-related lysozyme (muramidase)